MNCHPYSTNLHGVTISVHEKRIMMTHAIGLLLECAPSYGDLRETIVEIAQLRRVNRARLLKRGRSQGDLLKWIGTKAFSQ